MTPKETVDLIREAVSSVEKNGQSVVSIAGLKKFLDHIDSGQADKDIGLLFAARKDTALAKYRVQADLLLELFKSVITSGQTALKSMFLINGGAAVAMLALVGHLATSTTAAGKVGEFAIPLCCFALGLVLATTAAAFTYLAQRAYSRRRHGRRRGNALNAMIILLSVASLVAFVTGCGFAYQSIQALAEPNQPI